MDVYEKESIGRGHHVYKSVWTPSTREVLRALLMTITNMTGMQSLLLRTIKT